MFNVLGTEFWDAAKTLKFLAESSYFEGKENRGESSVKVRKKKQCDSCLKYFILVKNLYC